MANFISVPVKKFGNEDFSNPGDGTTGYNTMGIDVNKIIYAFDTETNLGKAVSAQTDSGDTITITGHGLQVNDAIYFDAECEATTVLANRVYFVKTVPTANTITVSDTLGGSVQNIAADGTSDTPNVFKIEGQIIYADTTNNGRPVDVIVNRGLIRQNHAGDTVQALSQNLLIVDCNEKNGIAYSGTDSNMIINTHRVMLSYDGGSDDWKTFYDASNTNMAGLDSPFVDVLELETSLNSAGTLAKFINHIGALGGPENFESLTVNGRTVSFPDVSASGIVRLTCVASAYESGSKTFLKIKGMGKNSWDTLVINTTLSNVVGSTDATNIVE